MVKLNDEPNVDWLDDVKLGQTREEIEQRERDAKTERYVAWVTARYMPPRRFAFPTGPFPKDGKYKVTIMEPSLGDKHYRTERS